MMRTGRHWPARSDTDGHGGTRPHFSVVFVLSLYLARRTAGWRWLSLVALIGVTIHYCCWSVGRAGNVMQYDQS